LIVLGVEKGSVVKGFGVFLPLLLIISCVTGCSVSNILMLEIKVSWFYYMCMYVSWYKRCHVEWYGVKVFDHKWLIDLSWMYNWMIECISDSIGWSSKVYDQVMVLDQVLWYMIKWWYELENESMVKWWYWIKFYGIWSSDCMS
jgi:hypothetical protein